MISVVVYAHGRDDLLRSTIESIAGNSSSDWHIVVVGDLSSRIASQQKPCSPDVISEVNTAGAPHAVALNVGLRHARGEIVGCLVAGDTYFEDTLSLVKQCAQARIRDDLFYGDAMIKSNLASEARELVTDKQNYAQNKRKCRLCGAATFYRKSILESLGGFDESLKFWSEYDLWLRVRSRGRLFKRIPRLLAARLSAPDRPLASDFASYPTIASLDELTLLRLSQDASRSPSSILARHFEGLSCLLASGLSPRAAAAKVTSSAIMERLHQLSLYERAALPFRTFLARWLHGFQREFAPRSHDPLRTLPRYWLKRRLFRFVHHAPRPMRIPGSYVLTPPPNKPQRISIVTPSFNQGKSLGKTIRSIIDQNYPNLEYFVQDGGSTDDSIEILQSFGSRLAGWASEPDTGQANAINVGFQKTTGDIMAYVNSDDILLPGALSYIAWAFQAYPKIDVFYGHRIVIDENDQELGRWVLPKHDDHAIKYADYIPQETMFWRRSAWERIGSRLNESFQSALDWDLILRFRVAGCTFKRLPRFLGAFRVWPGQKSVAWWLPTGKREAERLTCQTFGESPDQTTIRRETRSYLRKHWFYDKAFLLGFLRY